MGLFDRTEKHLAAGPTLLVSSEQVDAVAEWVRRYAPKVKAKSDRFFFDNGVFLYGPVEASPGTVGYYVRPAWLPKNEDRPENEKLLDGERLVRGLAVRLNGQKQSQAPWAQLHLEASVWAADPLPVERVIGVLQPFAGTDGDHSLFVDEERDDGSYILVSHLAPVFLTVFWAARLSRSRVGRPALALGAEGELCRWQLRTTSDAANADPELCRLVGDAAFALAAAANGTVVDMFGFPLASAEELLPA